MGVALRIGPNLAAAFQRPLPVITSSFQGIVTGRTEIQSLPFHINSVKGLKR